ncbi:radical SAM protein, partial [archaeon]
MCMLPALQYCIFLLVLMPCALMLILMLLLMLFQELPLTSGVMLRLGMTNPPYMLAHLEAIARCLNHPNVFAFLHIPVQAGSDRVLDAMRREYSVRDFDFICAYLTERVPGLTLATDIICGFPGETDDDFERTLELVRRHKFPVLNISQFYPRPGTPAAKMKRLDTQLVKSRSRKLTALFETMRPFENMHGAELPVWFGLEVSEDRAHSVGHSKGYVKVLVPLDPDLPGTCHRVRV